ncbi:sensor histidine kinase [Bacillus sp. REN10]|uniref:sensor histidine kinase n=1 Tax=Bacillus sp. REN10 TaxID=2782541 RepID=UPI00193C6ED1|nr:sensor histidine kinase [Bacillus sp. REN10]
MIKTYIRERLSWIMLFIFLQLLVILVVFIDPSIPVQSSFYIVFLSTLVFISFLIVRYHKETKFYQSLQNWDQDLDITNLSLPESPFEQIILESMTQQTKRLKQQATESRLLLEQEKDELLAWIHEVKTPLTAMHLIIDRLQDDKLKANMMHEWLRIHLLLDQQLHQKRMLFMENDLYIEQVQLEDMIFQEINTLRSWCIQKRIGFDVELNEATVLSDAKWLAFIIRQLLTNAVKYSEAADIIIKSYIENEQTVLQVQDFGRGIDPKDLPRIFDKGFTSTTEHQDNAATGMGLYLTKKIAKPLLIHITVQSELGKGTTFTLTFPKRNEFVHLTSM